jgi:hypothetical protein
VRSRLNIWIAALAALFLGIPLAEKAAASSSSDGGAIAETAIGLAEAIVDAAMQAS